MENNFKQKVNEYYQRKSLSQDKMDFLLSVQATAQRRARIRNLTILAAAASVLLSLFVFYPREVTLQSVAEEVVYNHRKNIPSEVLSDEYTVINEALDRLDFKIAASSFSPAAISLSALDTVPLMVRLLRK